MLIGWLALSALGMAVSSSSSRQPARQELSRHLFEEQLELPFGPSSDPEPWPKGLPNLFETFRITKTIFVVMIADGYLLSAHTTLEKAIEGAEFCKSNDPETTEISIDQVEVLMPIADELLEHGISNIGGGYEAQEWVAKNGRELTTVWEWSITDEPFDEWPEEQKENERKRVIENMERRILPKGTLLYHSTDTHQRIEDEEVDDLGFLPVVLDEAHARQHLTEPNYRPRPQAARLIRYRTLRDIPYAWIPSNHLNHIEEVLDLELSDSERTHDRLRELYKEDDIRVGHIGARGRILLRDATSKDIELIHVEPL